MLGRGEVMHWIEALGHVMQEFECPR